MDRLARYCSCSKGCWLAGTYTYWRSYRIPRPPNRNYEMSSHTSCDLIPRAAAEKPTPAVIGYTSSRPSNATRALAPMLFHATCLHCACHKRQLLCDRLRTIVDQHQVGILRSRSPDSIPRLSLYYLRAATFLALLVSNPDGKISGEEANRLRGGVQSG